MITKFTDSDNNICYMEYFPWEGRSKDHFKVWSEEFLTVKHIFHPEEVEELLDKGIWKRVN